MEAYQELEHELAKWINYSPENVVACSSGTAALHLALESLELPLGSKVIVPDLTMVACPRAVTMAGLKPVFVDCDERLLMDPGTIPGIDYQVIMPVHIYGRQCSMGRIVDWAGRMNAYIVEDLAEGHGIQPHPETDAACWSFYRNKIIAGEEGGAIAFKDPSRAKLARCLRSLGFTDNHDFVHVPRGHNYRMSNAHARLILKSLSALPTNMADRRKQVELYDRYCPDEWRMPPRDVPWVYDLRIPGISHQLQDRIVKDLQEKGIAARHCFKPMSAQEEYCGKDVPVGPHAFLASREVLYLPLTPYTVADYSARLAFDSIRHTLSYFNSMIESTLIAVPPK